MSAQESAPVLNGVSGPESEDYHPWADRKATQPKSLSPPQSQGKLSDSYSNTLPVRKSVTPRNSYATGKAPAALGGTCCVHVCAHGGPWAGKCEQMCLRCAVTLRMGVPTRVCTALPPGPQPCLPRFQSLATGQRHLWAP